MRNPEMTKKMSTPTKPPGASCGEGVEGEHREHREAPASRPRPGDRVCVDVIDVPTIAPRLRQLVTDAPSVQTASVCGVGRGLDQRTA